MIVNTNISNNFNVISTCFLLTLAILAFTNLENKYKVKYILYRVIMDKFMNTEQQKLLENATEVAGILKQLSNPYRLMILCCLSDNELTVGDLNQRIDLSQSALSQHLAKLRESNIVTTRRESQTIFYRIANPKIEELLRVLHAKFCSDEQSI